MAWVRAARDRLGDAPGSGRDAERLQPPPIDRQRRAPRMTARADHDRRSCAGSIGAFAPRRRWSGFRRWPATVRGSRGVAEDALDSVEADPDVGTRAPPWIALLARRLGRAADYAPRNRGCGRRPRCLLVGHGDDRSAAAECSRTPARAIRGAPRPRTPTNSASRRTRIADDDRVGGVARTAEHGLTAARRRSATLASHAGSTWPSIVGSGGAAHATPGPRVGDHGVADILVGRRPAAAGRRPRPRVELLHLGCRDGRSTATASAVSRLRLR